MRVASPLPHHLIFPLTMKINHYYDYIAANHSDFGGILPIFKQYSAIPIGMTVFRQNLKNYVLSKILEYFKICENHAQGCKAFHPVKYICASVTSCQILSR